MTKIHAFEISEVLSVHIGEPWKYRCICVNKMENNQKENLNHSSVGR